MSEFKKANEKIAEGVVNGFQKIENGVVEGYRKIEDGVVGAYKKVEDKFVNKFLTHEGESTEDAKKRLENEQADREAAGKKAAEKRAMAGNGTEIGRSSLKVSRETAKSSIEASQNAGNK